MPDPFLKWPGGKRWLSAIVATEFDPHLRAQYFEPFLGGGAVFFELAPKRAVLSDINGDLINVYVQVRDRWWDLVERLQQLPVNKRQYYTMRRQDPGCPLERAVRLLYLNRTAFSGMYRLNRAGQFNVPYGGGERTTECLWSAQLLEKASATLQGVELCSSDFEPILDRAGAADVVYCDPTYTVAHERNGFVRYNERNFAWCDQARLAEAAKRAAKRGAMVVVSNAYHDTLKRLYRGVRARKVSRRSLISPSTWGRRVVNEFLFILDPV